jgi:hypothetical protein
MDSIEKRIAEVFAAFETERNPELLYLALHEVEVVQRNAEPENRDACKRVLSLLLTFLAALDQHIDPRWDPQRQPAAGVPPPVPDLPVKVDGELDPAAIADPVIRARYEQELRTNAEDWARYKVQFQLRRVEERAVDDLELLAENCFMGSSADRQEFAELTNASSLGKGRSKKLRKLLRPRRWL